MFSSAIRYLIVPGRQGSPAEHWQSHWQRALPNARRVEQADWQAPQLRDWVWQLQQALELLVISGTPRLAPRWFPVARVRTSEGRSA